MRGILELDAGELTKWDARFLRLAGEVASWSKDPNVQVGAVVVSPDKRRVSYGYNGFPSGVDDTPERLLNGDLKNELMVHAEANAILNARTDVGGWTLYCTRALCHDCAKAVIQSGVAAVVHPAYAGGDWSKSIRMGSSIMQEAGICLREVHGWG